MKETTEEQTVEEIVCPVEDEAAVAATAAYLLDLRGPSAVRQLFARILVRLEALEALAKVGTGESKRLRSVEWMDRRSDAYLAFRVPGSAHHHRMRLGFLRASQNCALCGVDLHPGMQAYHAGWKTSSWLRHLRVCYECGQKKAPAPKAKELLE
jgi:hypothetical protein